MHELLNGRVLSIEGLSFMSILDTNQGPSMDSIPKSLNMLHFYSMLRPQASFWRLLLLQGSASGTLDDITQATLLTLTSRVSSSTQRYSPSPK